MNLRNSLPSFLLLATAACASLGALTSAQKRPLDHDVYSRWLSVEGAQLSRTGRWVSYVLQPDQPGDGELHVHAYDDDAPRHTVVRGKGGRIDHGEAFLVCRIEPERAAVLEAKKEKEDAPEAAMGILDLESGDLQTIEAVDSFRLPEKAGGWLAYRMKNLPEEDEGEDAEEGEEEESEKKSKKKDKDDDGRPLVLRELASGEETTFEHVATYALSEDGRWLAYATARTDDRPAQVVLVAIGSEAEPRALDREAWEYRSLSFDESGERLAFLSAQTEEDESEEQADSEEESEDDDAESEDDDDPTLRWRLHAARTTAGDANILVGVGDLALPTDWGVSENRSPYFSETGTRLFFGAAPLPPEEPDELSEDERVVVDVWSWTDDRIQPHQLEELEEDRDRTYLSVVHLDGSTPRTVVLANEQRPEARIPAEGDAPLALSATTLPYRKALSWDGQLYSDVYVVDVATGDARMLLERRRGRFSLSPGAKYVYGWDLDLQAWIGIATADGREFQLDAAIPHPMQYELHDSPSLARASGSGGWLADDAGIVLYDNYDIWLVDPRRPAQPRNLTGGHGRETETRYRVIDLDLEEEALDPGEPVLLSTFGVKSKRAGFGRTNWDASAAPEELLVDDYRFSTPVKAEEGEVVRFTRESFHDFPDVWVSDLGFAEPRQLSTANPWQSEYLWGDVELVEWTSSNGADLQGLLYTPEDFDPEQKYPLIAYFYERRSDTLHGYQPPTPHRSTIRIPFYTSRGYVVFVPDIPYMEGYPGQSALHAIVSGILHVTERGFVDEDAIGCQGHSWGGYQAAYLVTQTDLFAAAVAGAPVANMTSAYGGVRWGTGLSRMFQYEKTQSRIGGTLWESTQRYLDNSPLFYLDRVQTPLLIMHNDHDGAVPWYQGIELFLGLRRLDKPAWMLNYNDEPHWAVKWPNRRDYAIRMQQFFDHFLKGAPAPQWIAEGVPATQKGRDLGLELTPVAAE